MRRSMCHCSAKRGRITASGVPKVCFIKYILTNVLNKGGWWVHEWLQLDMFRGQNLLARESKETWSHFKKVFFLSIFLFFFSFVNGLFSSFWNAASMDIVDVRWKSHQLLTAGGVHCMHRHWWWFCPWNSWRWISFTRDNYCTMLRRWLGICSLRWWGLIGRGYEIGTRNFLTKQCVLQQIQTKSKLHNCFNCLQLLPTENPNDKWLYLYTRTPLEMNVLEPSNVLPLELSRLISPIRTFKTLLISSSESSNVIKKFEHLLIVCQPHA